jgi:WD40-like Beta Propeller Repeat
MSRDRFDVLERFAPLFEVPEPSFQGFMRRRDRKRRNQRIAAGVVAIAVFVAPVALFAGLLSSDRTQTPAAEDQSFADSINECERLLVTRQEVKSAFRVPAEDPGPSVSAHGVLFGCEYAFKLADGDGVAISAYPVDAPPPPLARPEPVQGIGDEARFTRFGTVGVDESQLATSILQVRIGDLILRFESSPGTFDLPQLRQLAEDALATLSGSGPEVPEVDYVVDLRTGEMNPLPRAILRSLGPDGRRPLQSLGQYAASPDGSRLAYVGTDDDGSLQIFTSGIDGTGVRQVTHDPAEASSPAWSPDGTRIAYEGYGTGDVSNLFVLDVATGESAQITHATRAVSQPQFTPDGSSLLYCGGSFSYPVLRSVPVAGGKSTVLFGRGRGGMADACNGSLSPDGSLVTMMGSEIGGGGALRFVANPDGTELRQIPGRASNPAGTWSPDGSRIVCSDNAGGIVVVDIATGDDSLVAEGSAAIWLDDHTLLVDVRGGS